MKYRYSTSLFAILLCTQLVTSSSLKAMEDDNRGTYVPVREPAVDKSNQKLKEVEEQFLSAQSLAQIEKPYKQLCVLAPGNLGDYELYYSLPLLNNNYFKEGLHLFSLASMRDSDEMKNNVSNFLNTFMENMTTWFEYQQDKQAYGAICAMNKSVVLKDFKEVRNNALSVLKFINGKLTTETYEFLFKLIHEMLYMNSKVDGDNFLKLVYKLGNPPGIRISNAYLKDILFTDKNTPNTEKYAVVKKIATDPLFLSNLPPRRWITDAKEGIWSEYVSCGIKEKDNTVVKAYSEMYIQKYPHFYNEIFLSTSLMTEDWNNVIGAIDEKGKYTSPENMKQLLLVKLVLLERLGRQDDVLTIVMEHLTERLKSLGKHSSKSKKKSEPKPTVSEVKPKSPPSEKEQPTVKKKKKKIKHVRNDSISNNNLQETEKIVNEKRPEEKAPEAIEKKQEVTQKILETKETPQTSFAKSESFFVEEKEKKEEPVLEKKEKVKTKGIPDESKDTKRKLHVNESKEEVKEEAPTKNILEILSGNPLKTFYTLFEPYKGQIKWKSLKVSFEEIDSLFEALNHEVGIPKGSHAKTTLNKDKQLQKDAEEKMLVIVKDTYLHPATLQQISETFIEYGLYPKELESLLRKKMLIIDKD